MQTSTSTEAQEWDAVLEASRLTAELEAACRIDASVSEDEAEDEAEELWTIPTCSRGRQVVLTRKNPKLDNYFSCLQD